MYKLFEAYEHGSGICPGVTAMMTGDKLSEHLTAYKTEMNRWGVVVTGFTFKEEIVDVLIEVSNPEYAPGDVFKIATVYPLNSDRYFTYLKNRACITPKAMIEIQDLKPVAWSDLDIVIHHKNDFHECRQPGIYMTNLNPALIAHTKNNFDPAKDYPIWVQIRTQFVDNCNKLATFCDPALQPALLAPEWCCTNIRPARLEIDVALE